MAYHKRQLLEKIEQCLDANPCISLSQLARKLGIDRRTVEKTTKELTGLTFPQYRRAKLVATLRQLLDSEVRRSIKEAAITSGYPHPQNFSRAVKRVTGYSPTVLRDSPKGIVKK